MLKNYLLRTAAAFAAAEATAAPNVLPKVKHATPDHLDAYTIKEFCRRHMLTAFLFYKMQREGLAPRVMVVGGRKFITAEAAAKWRKAHEQPAVSRGERVRKRSIAIRSQRRRLVARRLRRPGQNLRDDDV